ncbi:ICMT-domain-containing protein [Trametes cingulata]|nr:ICMT-domain-containing protein [Trametes cingulata]
MSRSAARLVSQTPRVPTRAFSSLRSPLLFSSRTRPARRGHGQGPRNTRVHERTLTLSLLFSLPVHCIALRRAAVPRAHRTSHIRILPPLSPTQMLTWTIVLCDALATLHLAAPTPLTRPLAAVLLPPSLAAQPSYPSSPSASASALPSSQPPTSALARALLTPHPLLLAGAALAVCGAALRLACFRALGALFTFELTISPTHRLVTDGPYAWVRHPSYAGVYAVLLGASGVMVAPGAWLREAWLLPSVCEVGRRALPWVGGGCRAESGGVLGALLAWTFVAFWTTKVVYALRSTNKRVGTEDAELHRVFGAQWEEWAGRVRWTLIPYVL